LAFDGHTGFKPCVFGMVDATVIAPANFKKDLLEKLLLSSIVNSIPFRILINASIEDPRFYL